MTTARPIKLIYALDAHCGWCYAFGPAVREPVDANMGGFVDESGIHSPALKDHGSQVLCRPSHHLAGSGAPREEDEGARRPTQSRNRVDTSF
jgi:hypothetical protein